ncbi:MAG: AAA family ATPase, partial [Ignavibacteriaceae bacterium]|nr:AAA family ATPase [Ignavibacteriaceae bacterium]
MKTTIRIQNFKSLEDVTLELAPTTVFLGPNGAGKSSVLKCLEFVSKNLEIINSQKLSPSIYKLSNDVDLGSYKEVVTKNDTQKDIIFSFKHQSRIERDYNTLGLSPMGGNVNDIRILILNASDKEKEKKNEEEFHLKLTLFEEWLGKDIFRLFSKPTQSELLMLNFSVNERLKFISKHFNKLNLELKISFTSSDDHYNFQSFKLVELSTKSEIVFETRINSNGVKSLYTSIKCNNPSIIINNIINETFIWKLSDSWNNYKALIEKLIFWYTNNYRNQFSSNNDISEQERLLLKTIATIILLFETTPHILKKFLTVDHLPSVRQVQYKQKGKSKKRGNDTSFNLFEYLADFNELQAILLADKIEAIQRSLPKGEEISLEQLDL